MRKISLLLFLVQMAMMPAACAQVFGLTAGYNISPVRLEHFNRVIDHYNETRPWLSKQMKHVAVLSGWDLGMGGIYGSLDFDFHFIQRKATVSSKGIVPAGSSEERKFRVASNSYCMMYMGYAFPLKRKMLFIAGYGIALSGISSKTKAGDDGTIKKQKFQSLGGTGLVMSGGPYMKIYRPPFYFRLAYEQYFEDFLFGRANQVLNPDTYSAYVGSHRETRPGHLTLSFGFLLMKIKQ